MHHLEELGILQNYRCKASEVANKDFLEYCQLECVIQLQINITNMPEMINVHFALVSLAKVLHPQGKTASSFFLSTFKTLHKDLINLFKTPF